MLYLIPALIIIPAALALIYPYAKGKLRSYAEERFVGRVHWLFEYCYADGLPEALYWPLHHGIVTTALEEAWGEPEADTKPKLYGFRSHTLFVALRETVDRFLMHLKQDVTDSGIAKVPLYQLLDHTGKTINDMFDPWFGKELQQKGLLSTWRRVYYATAAGLAKKDGEHVHAADYKGSALDCIKTYLHHSTFKEVFLWPVPYSLPDRARHETHWVCAPPGSGKTNALECMIAEDLERVYKGEASLFVMDDQGLGEEGLLHHLHRIEDWRFKDRLIYIEPSTATPLAFNIFATGDIPTIRFMFGSLFKNEFTPAMEMLFEFALPVMFEIPNATLRTFLELMTERGVAKYQDYITNPDAKRFFSTDFLSDGQVKLSRSAVRRRLLTLMSKPLFRAMFTQPQNKLDLNDAIQRGSIILVNAQSAGEYTEAFGRFMLALLMQATRKNLAIENRKQRRTVYAYIDECHHYIADEEQIGFYIGECRKQNVDLVFAHQKVSDIRAPAVVHAMENCAIKFTHTHAQDAGTFTARVYGDTYELTFEYPSPLAKAPKLTTREWEAVRESMYDRYGQTVADPIRDGDIEVEEPTRSNDAQEGYGDTDQATEARV